MGTLYNICDYAYNAAAGIMPKAVQKHPKILAFGFGLVSGYMAAKTAKYFMYEPFAAPHLQDPENTIRTIEQACLMGTASAPFIAAAVEPEQLKKWFTQDKPVYSKGVLGVMIGSSIAALEELLTK